MLPSKRDFPGGLVVKNLSVIQEIQVQSLGGDDPLEEEMQLTLAILPGKARGQRSLAGYCPEGHKMFVMAEAT